MIVITGSAGFIGRALCRHFSADHAIVGVDTTECPDPASGIIWEQADLTDEKSIGSIFKKHSPRVIIHCAGIAHQKIGTIDSGTYMHVNSEVTENLARVAAGNNPGMMFIFLSSVSVYGEEHLRVPVSEEDSCNPSSDYAASKLDAEQRLVALLNKGILGELVILRLAPVYDRGWSLNLDRRVFAPRKCAYLRYGTGTQRMSALARPNLAGFIEHIVQIKKYPKLRVFNVCDSESYEFNTIIRVFRESDLCPDRPVVSVPLPLVRFMTRLTGSFAHDTLKRRWIHSCYDKLASDLVFDNRNMLRTGYKPVHSMETIF